MESSKTLVLKHVGGLCKFSPDGVFLAHLVERNRLVIRSSADLGVVQIIPCTGTVNSIDWSPDSDMIMCGCLKESYIQVFSISKAEEFSCKICEGLAGVVEAIWTPDSRSIVTVAEFQLHLGVWSLTGESEKIIRNPKLGLPGTTFSPDGAFTAVAHRKDCKDYISIYSCRVEWNCLKNFEVATSDLEEIIWSPTGESICIRDSCFEYAVLLYSPRGEIIRRFKAYQNALGVKCCSWSADGSFLGIGSYDEACRIINTLTWKEALKLEHSITAVPSQKIIKNMKNAKNIAKSAATNENSNLLNTQKGNINISSSRTVCVVHPDPTKPLPKQGVGSILWSADCKYLATRNENMPYTVWIWTIKNCRPSAVLEFDQKICNLKWDPSRTRLAIATLGNSSIVLWTPEYGAQPLEVQDQEWSEKELTKGLRWHPIGISILLVSKGKMVNVATDPVSKTKLPRLEDANDMEEITTQVESEI